MTKKFKELLPEDIFIHPYLGRMKKILPIKSETHKGVYYDAIYLEGDRAFQRCAISDETKVEFEE